MAQRVSEKEWMATVVETAMTLGWSVYHTYDSRRSAAGFPDLVLAREPLLMFVELKTDYASSQLTDGQKRWLKLLANCGQACYVWRPSDWRPYGRYSPSHSGSNTLRSAPKPNVSLVPWYCLALQYSQPP